MKHPGQHKRAAPVLTQARMFTAKDEGVANHDITHKLAERQFQTELYLYKGLLHSRKEHERGLLLTMCKLGLPVSIGISVFRVLHQ